MPALITHDFFGRDVYDRLYTFIGGSRDEADAFLLGNQGPDPLFYLVLSPQLRAHNRLGSTMHNKKPSELLTALKNSLGILKSAKWVAPTRWVSSATTRWTPRCTRSCTSTSTGCATPAFQA